MKKFLFIMLWAIAALFVLDIALRLISTPDTMASIIGVVVLVLMVAVSVWTKCFTNFKFKKQNEKDC